MPSPMETVTAFLEEFGKGKSEMVGAFEIYFTPKTVWELVGYPATTGADEAISRVKSTQDSHGMDHVFVETLAMAAAGQTVLTERVDNVRAADGSNLDSCRCMGVFEVEGGKIIAWREYYDTATHGA